MSGWFVCQHLDLRGSSLVGSGWPRIYCNRN